MAQRRSVQAEALQSLASGQRDEVRAIASLFPATALAAPPSIQQIQEERMATQAELCTLPGVRQEDLRINEMDMHMQHASDPLHGLLRLTFPSSSWGCSCQCPCGCGSVVKRYTHTYALSQMLEMLISFSQQTLI